MRHKIITMLAALLLLFSNSKEKLIEINLKIKEITTRIASIKTDKSSILNEIYALELETEAVVIELHRLQLLLADTQEQIDRKQMQEAQLQKEILNSRENIKRILRVLYKMGELGYVKLFIHINNLDQLFRNYRLIVSLMDDRLAEIENIRQGISKLRKIKTELKKKYEQFSKLENEMTTKRNRLNELKQNKLDIIAKINRQRDVNLQLLEELKVESENLTRLLNRTTAALQSEPASLAQLRGKLTWPLLGNVISSFGKKKSSRFNTYTFNYGIEIKPTRSDEIKAIHGGEIIFCDHFKGYGNLLIIQHPGNFHSLYGHCEKFIKNQGDRVHPGETIALAGNSGSLHGKCLYFEIRQNLKPQDPLLWLSKR